MKLAVRALPLAALVALMAPEAQADPGIRADDANPVLACATPGRLMAFLRHRNPALDRRFEIIAQHYMREGAAIGVRWDYAFFQMVVETGALTFRRGDGQPGTVAALQNNFAGLGAVSGRDPGETFPDIATGVRAHLQHIVLYTGARVADPVSERTRKVQDWGILAAWQKKLGRPTTFPDLAMKWAPDSRGYWMHIESVARRFREGFCNIPDPEPMVASQGQRHRVASGEPFLQPAPAQPPAEVSGFTVAREALERLIEPRPVARSGLGARNIEPPTVPQAQSQPSASVPPRQQMAAGPVTPQRPAATAPVQPPPAVAQPVPAPAAVTPPRPARPTAEEVANEKLRQLVSGRTVNLDTPIGTVIPIEFAEDGSMRGKAGGLSGYLGAATDQGQWWVDKGKLCQRWKVWFKSEQQCLKFKQSGNIIHWVSDNGRSGTAKLVP